MSSLFAQSSSVLLGREVDMEEVSSRLRRFNILGPKEGAEGPSGWVFGGDGLLISMEPELTGVILVDQVPHRWPDDLGEAEPESELHAAWELGYFGPHVSPRSLERATQQSWIWEKGPAAVADHQGFLRVRSTYAPKEPGEPAELPRGYNPLLEMLLMTEVCDALLELPEALAYFNPNGETLRDAVGLRDGLRMFSDEGMPPLDLWANVRLHVNPHLGWTHMDTVGMAQLQVSDHEACFASDSVRPEDVDGLLRTASYTQLVNKLAPRNGTELKGPGGNIWRSTALERGLAPPERPVIRWIPEDGRELPAELRR